MADIGRRIKQIVTGTIGALGISYLSLLGINNSMYNSEEYKDRGPGESYYSVTRADGAFFRYTTFTRVYKNGMVTKDSVGQDRPRFFRYFGHVQKTVVDGGKFGNYDGLVDLVVVDSMWSVDLLGNRVMGGSEGFIEREKTGEHGPPFNWADELLSATKNRFKDLLPQR